MTTINVPTRDEVSPANQAIFDNLKRGLGMVPNLYATMARSEHALGNYLAFQNAKSSVTGKAREVINLVVSEVNACEYCLAAHTVIAKMQGLSDAHVLEIRSGKASFDRKIDALARLVQSIAAERGRADPALLEQFFSAGWNQANLIDVITTIGDKTVTNYLYAATRVPVDFPPAPKLPV
jgi:AhpD family alkylhydroperoxidase